MNVYTKVNNEYGLEVTVTKTEGGYAVRLQDTDAKEFLPEIRIFNDMAQAIEYAQSLSK